MTLKSRRQSRNIGRIMTMVRTKKINGKTDRI